MVKPQFRVASPRRLMELPERLLSRIPPEAREMVRHAGIDLIESTLYSSAQTQRMARVILLMFIDALNDKRSTGSRQRRWSRFVRKLALFAPSTHSPVLARIVRENTDLLTP